MVPGVSSLIARKFGVSPNIMKFRNETIRTLQRNIWTVCGFLMKQIRKKKLMIVFVEKSKAKEML